MLQLMFYIGEGIESVQFSFCTFLHQKYPCFTEAHNYGNAFETMSNLKAMVNSSCSIIEMVFNDSKFQTWAKNIYIYFLK